MGMAVFSFWMMIVLIGLVGTGLLIGLIQVLYRRDEAEGAHAVHD